MSRFTCHVHRIARIVGPSGNNGWNITFLPLDPENESACHPRHLYLDETAPSANIRALPSPSVTRPSSPWTTAPASAHTQLSLGPFGIPAVQVSTSYTSISRRIFLCACIKPSWLKLRMATPTFFGSTWSSGARLPTLHRRISLTRHVFNVINYNTRMFNIERRRPLTPLEQLIMDYVWANPNCTAERGLSAP